MNKWTMRLWLFLSAALMALPGLQARPLAIILLRHAEKSAYETDPHLSVRGHERAHALTRFLTNNAAVARLGQPTALFACRPARLCQSQRPRETMEPLAAQLKVPIQSPYEAKQYAALASHVLMGKEWNGKVIVICWVREYLPELAAALGVRPEPRAWKANVFDEAWVVEYRGVHPSLQIVRQRLLAGDRGR